MPKGVRRIYPECFCEICGKKLQKVQIVRSMKWKGRLPRFCSSACMDRHDKMSSPGTIKEPVTYGELKAIEKLKSERMKELQADTKAIIQRQTPKNDSPEAERRLREALCPNPPAYVFAHGSVVP